MKSFLQYFLQFSRMERLGILAFGTLLLFLLLLRFSLSFWVHPRVFDPALQDRMKLAYQKWQLEEAANDDPSNDNNASASNPIGERFTFDPNTLDSLGFVRLGFPEKALKGLLNWRRKGKHFYTAEDLKPLYHLPPAFFDQIYPYIRVGSQNSSFEDFYPPKGQYAAIPDIINLNLADSALLDRALPGIGAVLAHKIVVRRTALGGFIRVEQLKELYPFSDSLFQVLRKHILLDSSGLRKMDLNTVGIEDLRQHPYIGEKVGRNILLYREGIKSYKHIEEIRQVPLMSEEIYRKIAPYFLINSAAEGP